MKKLEILYDWGNDCAGGNCPTIYKDDNNNYVLQGFVVDTTGVTVPNGETLIELPKEFLEGFIKSFNKANNE